VNALCVVVEVPKVLLARRSPPVAPSDCTERPQALAHGRSEPPLTPKLGDSELVERTRNLTKRMRGETDQHACNACMHACMGGGGGGGYFQS
jgi:hypothetical protein